MKKKIAVRVVGSQMGQAGWVENLVLDVGEGFTNVKEAHEWGKAALERLRVSGKTWAKSYSLEEGY
jgi:hypothetical protein